MPLNMSILNLGTSRHSRIFTCFLLAFHFELRLILPPMTLRVDVEDVLVGCRRLRAISRTCRATCMRIQNSICGTSVLCLRTGANS